MTLKTYDVSVFYAREGLDAFDRSDSSNDPIVPGTWVRHYCAGGHGLVVALTVESITILWSLEPVDPYSKFVLPIIKSQANYFGIARQLVIVQPMSMPVGNIFYLDYVYGETELDKKCKTGPWCVKMMWRSWRWLITRTQLKASSLSSFWRSSRIRNTMLGAKNVLKRTLSVRKRMRSRCDTDA